MKKGISSIREWLLAGGVMILVLGLGVVAWQWSTHFHVTQSPNATTTTISTHTNANNSIPQSVDPGVTLSAKQAPDFHLINQFGTKGSLSDYRGKVVILSFIDSKGTTVSPLTAVVLQNVRYDLGKYASKVALVAVNANPAATSVKDVYNWSKEHHVLHMWNYFTGTKLQLESVYHSYAVQAKVLQGTNVQFTPAVYVIGPNGHEKWIYLNAVQSSNSVIGYEVHDILKRVIPMIPGHPNKSIPPIRQLAFLPGKFGPKRNTLRPFTLPAILPNGQTGEVQVGHGKYPKLLDFFATWCPDCEEEMPTLSKFEHWSTGKSGYPSVIGVDLRLSESSTKHVKGYAQRLKLPFPIALDNHDKVANTYAVNGIPTQVLVSSSGKILWYHQGLIGLSKLESQVKKALNA